MLNACVITLTPLALVEEEIGVLFAVLCSTLFSVQFLPKPPSVVCRCHCHPYIIGQVTDANRRSTVGPPLGAPHGVWCPHAP